MTDNNNNALQRGLDNIQPSFTKFIGAQSTSSLFLLVATIVALWWANSDFSSGYKNLIDIQYGLILGNIELQTSLKYIINDGLMVIFFFVIGLEIKREVLAGELALPANRRMLILCAVGGMICPAVIYSLFNWSLDSQIGWGIPMATDTAFALGVLTLIKKHIPISLIAFIVGLAIVDDVGAILVIALFYTQEISLTFLLISLALIALLAAANYAGVIQPTFYIVGGVAAWWMMLKSGVHPTFAGVLIALTIPARPLFAPESLLKKVKTKISSMQKNKGRVDALGSRQDHEKMLEIRDIAESASAPLRRWEGALHLPVSLIVLPLFALVNAGVGFSLSSFIETLQNPTGLGIVTGLIVGKLVGITGACWLGLRYNIGCLPEGMNIQHVIGVSFIAGIGFTMSTFIASLGFNMQPELLISAKTSILFASILAAMLGLFYLRFVAKNIS